MVPSHQTRGLQAAPIDSLSRAFFSRCVRFVAAPLAATQTDDALSASGGPIVAGAASITQDDNALVASGTVVANPVTGSLAVTQADDTLSAAAAPVVGAALSETQPSDTLAAAGGLTLPPTFIQPGLESDR